VLRWLRQRTPIVYQKPLSEQELNAALAVSESDPQWRAVLQLIVTAEENANVNAAANMDPATVLAGYVGGADHLRMLREELLNRREEGLDQLGARVRMKGE